MPLLSVCVLVREDAFLRAGERDALLFEEERKRGALFAVPCASVHTREDCAPRESNERGGERLSRYYLLQSACQADFRSESRTERAAPRATR